jgi:hypothetical protein
MRNLIFIAIITSFASSCFKSNKPNKTFRYVGYIYNVEDSLPFTNTKFKIFNNGGLTQVGDEKTHLFTTDSNGHFDVTTDFLGSAFWPSYFVGSAYTGPQAIISNGDTNNVELNQWVTLYNSYTKPYF